MPNKESMGLVERMSAMLADLPTLPAIKHETAPETGGHARSTAARRARLALRIAILRSSNAAAPAAEARSADVIPLSPPVESVVQTPVVAPPPEPVIVVPPPSPTPKPARFSIATVRLEDAALLLAAASTPAVPPSAGQSAHSLAPPATDAQTPASIESLSGSGATDIQDLDVALSGFGGDPAGADPAAFVSSNGAKPTGQQQTGAKAKRRSGSVSASDGLANAAAALAALQAPDPDDATPSV